MAGEAHTEDGAAFGGVYRPYRSEESLLQRVPGGKEGDDRVPEREAERGSTSGDYIFTGEIQRQRTLTERGNPERNNLFGFLLFLFG